MRVIPTITPHIFRTRHVTEGEQVELCLTSGTRDIYGNQYCPGYEAANEAAYNADA